MRTFKVTVAVQVRTEYTVEVEARDSDSAASKAERAIRRRGSHPDGRDPSGAVWYEHDACSDEVEAVSVHEV